MKSQAYILGFVCGLLAVVAVSLLIRRIVKRKIGPKAYEYDERQRIIQGSGYRLAYFTLLICIVLGGITEVAAGVSWIGLFPFAVLCMWISISVFVTYCVIRDAYFTLETKRTALMIGFLLVGLINIGCVILEKEPLLTEGKLNSVFANLCTGICTLFLSAVMLVKALAERRQEGDE